LRVVITEPGIDSRPDKIRRVSVEPSFGVYEEVSSDQSSHDFSQTREVLDACGLRDSEDAKVLIGMLFEEV